MGNTIYKTECCDAKIVFSVEYHKGKERINYNAFMCSKCKKRVTKLGYLKSNNF